MVTIGRIVLYKLTEQDAAQINRRRTTGNSIADRIKEEKWPLGAQAHIGNYATVGEIYPMIVSRVWLNEFGADIHGINGQVLLDGNDTLWVASAREGELPGQWAWPKREA